MHPAGRGQTGVPTETVSDPDDFYYYQGKPIHLERSLSELVLGIAEGVDEQRMFHNTATPVAVGTAILNRGRRYHIVTLDTPSSEALKRLFESVRSRPEVWFVAPVYYYPADRVRMVPTDEVVVKVKPGVTDEEISSAVQKSGVRVESRLTGTSNEYVLRLVSPSTSDVLRVSRVLYETGLFLWAEPNFIQERRGAE